jgi:hypothetical protein
VQLFHYHLVTSKVREVEARYVGKLGFRLVARYGRVGERPATAEPGVPPRVHGREERSLDSDLIPPCASYSLARI